MGVKAIKITENGLVTITFEAPITKIKEQWLAYKGQAGRMLVTMEDLIQMFTVQVFRDDELFANVSADIEIIDITESTIVLQLTWTNGNEISRNGHVDHLIL